MDQAFGEIAVVEDKFNKLTNVTSKHLQQGMNRQLETMIIMEALMTLLKEKGIITEEEMTKQCEIVTENMKGEKEKNVDSGKDQELDPKSEELG